MQTTGARRRGRGGPRQQAGRPYRVHFSLTEQEFAAVEAGGRAGRAGPGRVRGPGGPGRRGGAGRRPDGLVRDALGELIRAAGLVRRIGVNLNQAVARLNATGQRSGDLLPYAGESMRRAATPDHAAETSGRRSGDIPDWPRSGRSPQPRGDFVGGDARRNAPGRSPAGADHSGAVGGFPRMPSGGGPRPVIGKISDPRGERVQPLIYYLFGPGRRRSTPTRTSWPGGGTGRAGTAAARRRQAGLPAAQGC